MKIEKLKVSISVEGKHDWVWIKGILLKTRLERIDFGDLHIKNVRRFRDNIE